jgi:UTP:GlnB (protein PII) uridylyltransferase
VGPHGGGLRGKQNIILAENIPYRQEEIENYCHKVVQEIEPDCIILHGSVAKGTYTVASDIDLLIIGGDLPEQFLERIYFLLSLNDSGAPIEPLAYTVEEFIQMLEAKHLTALEALSFGLPLYGAELFQRWAGIVAAWRARGLKRTTCSWVIPPDI